MEQIKFEKVIETENSMTMSNKYSDELAEADKEDHGETTLNTMTEMMRKNFSLLTNGSQKSHSIKIVYLSISRVCWHYHQVSP